MQIQLKNVRLAFADIFEAKSVNGSDPRFSATLILEGDDHPSHTDMEEAMKLVAEAKWGKKADKILDGLIKKEKVCYRNGDDKSDKYDGFEGNMYVAAANKSRPLVIDLDGKTELTQIDGKPYAGCYVYASVEIWAQDNSYGQRVNASLRGVQFFKDGDAFSGGAPASPDDFEDLSAGSSEDAEDDMA